MISTKEAAELLLQSRVKHRTISYLPKSCCPENLQEAYQCQDSLTEEMLKTFGGKQIGFKAACTNKTAQSLFSVDEPFYGPLLSPFVFQSPARLRSNEYLMRLIEPEFGFLMGDSLPKRTGVYKQEDVMQAISAVFPAIEVVDTRFTDWTQVGAPSLIADIACNAAWIHGRPQSDWSKYDLSNHEVNLYVNGMPKRSGSGFVALGNPLNVVTWLANTLSEQGKGLERGDYISTGSTCEVYFAQLGDRIKADFGPIGSVELDFLS